MSVFWMVNLSVKISKQGGKLHVQRDLFVKGNTYLWFKDRILLF